MERNSRAPRSMRALAIASGLALLTLWAPRDSVAQATAYGGSAAGDLVHVHALNVPDTFELAEAAVAPSLAEMSSTGIEGGGNSYARATNLDVELLSGNIPLTGLLVEAEHRSPGDDPGGVEETLIDVPADPLLNATVARASADSNWNTGGCVPVGTPIATSQSHLANANVLTGTPAGDALVALNNAQGETVFTHTTTELVDVTGQVTKGVRSTALTQLTAITLFKGTDNQLTVNVLAPPQVQAVATGQPGGAEVTYTEPVLQVVDSTGNILGELNAASANFELDLSPLAILRLGHLTSDVADDGTSAEGRAVLLEVIVLDQPGSIEPLARLTVAGGEVSASVPAGGVDCTAANGGIPGDTDNGDNGECVTANPLSDLNIESSQPVVTADSRFTYTITVSNNGECVLTDVEVSVTIDGPDGSEVVATEPEADEVEGLVVTWNDVGPLDPGASRDLLVTIAVPADASDGDSFGATVDANAVGGGEEFSQSARVDGPSVSSETEVGGISLPATGGSIAILVLTGLTLLLGGESLRRWRRWIEERAA